MLTLGQRLCQLRREKGLSQRSLAATLGVSQRRYSRWEREVETVPVEWLAVLADALDAGTSVLSDVHVDRKGPILPPFLRAVRRRLAYLPYTCNGSIEEMTGLNQGARQTWEAVRRLLSPADTARLAQRFPRDSAFELLAACHVILLGGYLARLTLNQLRCPVLTAEDYRSMRSAAYCLRDCLVLENDDLNVVMFPQVWVVSVVQSEWYRLDFLCYARRRDGTERWMYVEIEGSQHEYTLNRDKRRAQGIQLRRLQFDAAEVLRYHFGEALLRRIGGVLDEEPLSFQLAKPRPCLPMSADHPSHGPR